MRTWKRADIAGLVLLLLRQHVHAIARGAAEPPFVLADDPDRCGGARELAARVARFGAHERLRPRRPARLRTSSSPCAIGRAVAGRRRACVVSRARLVGVEAADQPLAIGVATACGRARRRHVCAATGLPSRSSATTRKRNCSLARDPALARECRAETAEPRAARGRSPSASRRSASGYSSSAMSCAGPVSGGRSGIVTRAAPCASSVSGMTRAFPGAASVACSKS